MIKIIFGPMGAGKSEEILRICKRYELARKKVLYISPKIVGKTISSRNGNSVNSINELKKNTDGYDIICIDEAQFFDESIIEYVDDQANKGKIVIISSLDGDFKKQTFGHVAKLIPLAEEVIKLSGICYICGKEAHFSKKLDNSLDDINKEKYITVCRQHFFKK